ncbi:MAG: Ig-like domain-containing protein, partial [Thermoproteota archaeon]
MLSKKKALKETLLLVLFLTFVLPQQPFAKGLLLKEESSSTEAIFSTSSLFNPVISSVSDKVGDVPSQYSYIDIVYAEIRQINLDTLQFEMKVKSSIPLNPGKGVVTYLWLIDTDLDPNTGQKHFFVGSEYNIRAAFYDGHWQGWVDPIGPRPGGGQCPVFVDNDTVSILVKRSQIGDATRFSWEVSASDDRGGYDGADSYNVCQVLFEIPSSGVVSEILLSPSYLILSKGVSNGKISINVKDANGRKLPFSSVKFFADYPSMVSITNLGEVTAIPGKFGHCWITAKVDGIISSNHVEVTVGSAILLPPIMLLSPDSPTGKLTVQVYDAYGNTIYPKTVEFSSSSPSVATVDNTGLVTAIRPPRTFGETPCISAKVDGVPVSNVAVVRVTKDNLGITLKALPGKHVVFYIPEQPIQGFDYQKIFNDYDVVKITDIAYELESEATGVVPYGGDTLFLVNDPGHEDGTVPYGLSGNPIRLGSSVDIPNSGMIVCRGFGFPQWFVYFHEMGHDFTLEGTKPGQFFFGGAKNTFVYVEGLASALGMYVAKMIKERSSKLNISDYILINLMTLWHFGSTPSLDRYLKNGAHYDEMTPDVLDEMIDVICTKYGYDSLYRFYSLFLPRDVPFTFTVDSDAKQATVFVAALSAATGVDLRSQFKKWGFPIDDNYYVSIWNEVNRLVNQRVHNLIVNLPLSNSVFWVKVDGVNKTGSPAIFKLPEGKHILQVAPQVHIDGLRYLFSQWDDGSSENPRSIELVDDLNLTVKYIPQVRVAIYTSYGTTIVSNWYEVGQGVTVSMPQTVIYYGNGTRRVFKGWYENGSLVSNGLSLSIVADRPRTIVAGWETEYEVNVSSERGVVNGSGWYKADTSTTITISPTQVEKDFFTNYVFEGWKVNREIVSTSPTYSFVVKKPVALVASWRTELNIVSIGLVAVILLVVAATFLVMI